MTYKPMGENTNGEMMYMAINNDNHVVGQGTFKELRKKGL